MFIAWVFLYIQISWYFLDDLEIIMSKTYQSFAQEV